MKNPSPTCVITGASAGIGRETARGMAERGYAVIVVGRDRARTDATVEYVRSYSRGAPVESRLCDFSSLAAVRKLAQELHESLPRLDVLINNAGLWHPKRQLSQDGIEDTLAVNYLAPFLLTNLLLPRLRATGSARIVHVSSRLHEGQRQYNFDDPQATRSYQGLRVYAQSKLATVMFSCELAERLAGSGVTSNALHPGDVISDILREQPVLRFFSRLAAPFFDTPASASLTSLYVATAPELATVSGGYFKKQKPARPAPLSEDKNARARLWQLSAELVGLPSGGAANTP